MPVQPAPHWHVRAPAGPYPSRPRRADGWRVRLGPPARNPVGGPRDVARPVDVGLLAWLVDEAPERPAPSERISQIREYENVSLPAPRLAALGPHELEQQARVLDLRSTSDFASTCRWPSSPPPDAAASASLMASSCSSIVPDFLSQLAHSLTSRLLQPTIAAVSAWLCPPLASITRTPFLLDIAYAPFPDGSPSGSFTGKVGTGTIQAGTAVPLSPDWRYRHALLLK